MTGARLPVVVAALWLAAAVGGCQGTHAAGPDGSRDGGAGAGGGAGKGGAAGSAGGAAGANPLCTNSAPFDRSCTSDDECVAGFQNGCPAGKYVGIRASELARFNAFQKACNPPQQHTTNGCDSPPAPPKLDDGSLLHSDAQAKVACQSGTCTTYSSSCGHVCGSGSTCFNCATAAGNSFAACTTPCSTSSTCEDPGFPSCQATLAFDSPLIISHPQFCAPAGVVCCNPCTSRPDGGGPDARGDAAAD